MASCVIVLINGLRTCLLTLTIRVQCCNYAHCFAIYHKLWYVFVHDYYSWNPWNLSFRHVLFHEKKKFSDIGRKWILPNMIRAGTDCTQIVLVNSHQRWKQTWNRACFHLWCELTLALWCLSIVRRLFSVNRPNHIS